jgi:hypothetical protein
MAVEVIKEYVYTPLITPIILYITTQEIKLSKWLDCSKVKPDKYRGH